MSVADVAERTSRRVDSDADGGSLFDETASWYARLRERSEKIMVDTLCSNAREALRPYRHMYVVFAQCGRLCSIAVPRSLTHGRQQSLGDANTRYRNASLSLGRNRPSPCLSPQHTRFPRPCPGSTATAPYHTIGPRHRLHRAVGERAEPVPFLGRRCRPAARRYRRSLPRRGPRPWR